MKTGKMIVYVCAVLVIGFLALWLSDVSSIQAQPSEPEITENQEISVNDEIFKTIHVQLEDGIASSDGIR